MQRTYQELARFVVESFSKLGNVVNPLSRVMRQHDVLMKSAGENRFDPTDHIIAVEALRDFQMLGLIFDHANDAINSEYTKRVKVCLQDSTIPDADKSNTPGRDAQFELFAAAVCKNANLRVEYAEPDVVFWIGNLKYCIAAKRPKSIKAIDENLRKACKQITDAKLPGFIVMDTSLAFALERNEPPAPDLDEVWELMRQWSFRLAPLPDHEFGDHHKSLMKTVIGKFKGQMDRRMEGKPVLGIIFENQIPRRLQDGTWGLSGAQIKYPTSTGAEFEIVAEQYLRGLPCVG